METTARQPIIICDGKTEFNSYIGKVLRFATTCDDFKEIFEEIVQKNLNEPYSKKWILSATSNGFSTDIGEVLLRFIGTHPPILRTAIDQEFTRISTPLFDAAGKIDREFNDLKYYSKAMGSMFPESVIDFKFLPITEDGIFDISQEWNDKAEDLFVTRIESEIEFERYDIISELNDIKDRFKKLYGGSANRAWDNITANLYPITDEGLIKTYTKAI